MNLLDSSEVCDLLGISKSTLYRWCGVSEEPAALSLGSGIAQTNSLASSLPKAGLGWTGSALTRALQQKGLGLEETPSDFPRPFKIGRSFKWKDAEIMAWLETRRV